MHMFYIYIHTHNHLCHKFITILKKTGHFWSLLGHQLIGGKRGIFIFLYPSYQKWYFKVAKWLIKGSFYRKFSAIAHGSCEERIIIIIAQPLVK